MKKLMCVLGVVMAMVVGVSWMAPSAMAATNEDICNDEYMKTLPKDKQKELKAIAGCDMDDETVMPLAVTLIETVISVAGILAVGVIVYGGFTYTTSTGDANKANKGKNILIYGVAGLIVALLSWAIVHFVSVSIFS